MNNFRFTQSLAVSLVSAACCWPTYAADPKPLTTADLLEMSLAELMQVKVVSEATGRKQTVSTSPVLSSHRLAIPSWLEVRYAGQLGGPPLSSCG